METSVNNKCKAFTSLEQSKKLAEILPLESADMCYLSEESLFPRVNYNGMVFFYSEEERPITTIPCWSLAALMNMLPNNENIAIAISRGGWEIEPPKYIDRWFCEYENDENLAGFNTSADNPIDTAFEMIIKLHEQKLL